MKLYKISFISVTKDDSDYVFVWAENEVEAFKIGVSKLDTDKNSIFQKEGHFEIEKFLGEKK